MPLNDDLVDFTGVTSGVEAGDTTQNSDAPNQSANQSRIISRVLAPALRLWLRSQLEQVEDLHLKIEAGDRQLLGGGISRVVASASKAVYRGLHFSRVQVTGQGIKTNLGQVLRGKPFRLLAAFPVTGEVTLSEADLNASLNAPLLATAVTEFLLSLLQPDTQAGNLLPNAAALKGVQVQLGTNELTFTGILIANSTETPIAVRTGLSIKKGNLLKLEGFQHHTSVNELIPTQNCKTNVTIPLGSDVHLDTLSVQPDCLTCQGRITVMPGE